MVVWAGFPGAAVVGDLVQPVYAWVEPFTTRAWRSIDAACAETDRGVLLLSYPGQSPTASFSSADAPSCVSRQFVQRGTVTLPAVWGGSLVVEYAPPST